MDFKDILYFIKVLLVFSCVTCERQTKYFPPPIRLSDAVPRACMKKDTDRLVYRYQNDTHIFIGFDVINDNVIYSKVWKMVGPRGEYLVDKNENRKGFDRSDATNIRQRLTTDHLLAASNQTQQRQLKESLKTCKKKNHILRACLIEVFAANSEKMRHVKIDDTCQRS